MKPQRTGHLHKVYPAHREARRWGEMLQVRAEFYFTKYELSFVASYARQRQESRLRLCMLSAPGWGGAETGMQDDCCNAVRSGIKVRG
jgi:hypothetical protein